MNGQLATLSLLLSAAKGLPRKCWVRRLSDVAEGLTASSGELQVGLLSPDSC
jgi:hypothetical protein